MQKTILMLIAIPALLYAAYNPFFTENKSADKPTNLSKAVEKTVITKYKVDPTPKRKNIKMTYFGFVESSKGKFALVRYNKKNIVIRENNSLYLDEQIFKIKQINSNYILLSDRYSRVQTVHFSSEIERRQQWQQSEQ